MKTTISIIFFFIVVSLNSVAQVPIPHGDFTNWQTGSSGYLDPIGWLSSNLTTPVQSVFQDADRSGGSGYSVKFTTFYDSTSGQYGGGMLLLENQPFTGSTRPSLLTGYWKKVSTSNSNGLYANIVMYDAQGNEIADDNINTPLGIGVPNWTSFNIPISYSSGDPVASYDVTILLYNFTGDSTMYGNFDDLAFDVSTGVSEVIQEELECEIQLIDGKNVIMLNKKVGGEVIVDVWDLKGQLKTTLIQSYYPSGENYIPLDFDLANGGLYLCRVMTEERMKVFKLFW